MFWGIQRGFQFAHLHLLICLTNIYWAATVYQMLVLGAFRIVTQISPGRRQSPLLLPYRWERQAGSLPKFAWLVNSRTAVWTQVGWPRACGFCSKSWQSNGELETWKDSCEGETGKRSVESVGYGHPPLCCAGVKQDRWVLTCRCVSSVCYCWKINSWNNRHSTIPLMQNKIL